MMGKYFTLTEMCRSNTAASLGIHNSPTSRDIAERLEALIDNVLDPVRQMWGAPLTVNSGYRCSELNTIIRGAKSSQHMTGEAADITTGTKEGNRKLFEMISTSGIPFDQLIDESGYSWIHISYSKRHRRQILHL